VPPKVKIKVKIWRARTTHGGSAPMWHPKVEIKVKI